jgi:nitrogen fixation NifU-like protein
MRLGREMFSGELLEHFQNPRNVGELAPPAVRVEVSNPACGDTLRLFALFEKGRVAAAAYKTLGCTATIAAGSALTTWMEGRTPRELGELDAGQIAEALGGLPPASAHAAVLCVDAVRALLDAYKETSGRPS